MAPRPAAVALVVTEDARASSRTIASLEARGFVVFAANTDQAALQIGGAIAVDLTILHDVEVRRARALVAALRRSGQTATVIACRGPDLEPTLVDVVIPGASGARATFAVRT